jgi:hypothetical protein
MSHFNSADESCKHGKDESGKVEETGKGDEEGEEGGCEESEVLFAPPKSRWHDTWMVPITATDLSVLFMMRRSNSSLLPG